MEDETSKLPDYTFDEWYLVMRDWQDQTVLNNLPGAKKIQDRGDPDPWAAAVIQVAKERGL